MKQTCQYVEENLVESAVALCWTEWSDWIECNGVVSHTVFRCTMLQQKQVQLFSRPFVFWSLAGSSCATLFFQWSHEYCGLRTQLRTKECDESKGVVEAVWLSKRCDEGNTGTELAMIKVMNKPKRRQQNSGGLPVESAWYEQGLNQRRVEEPVIASTWLNF